MPKSIHVERRMGLHNLRQTCTQILRKSFSRLLLQRIHIITFIDFKLTLASNLQSSFCASYNLFWSSSFCLMDVSNSDLICNLSSSILLIWLLVIWFYRWKKKKTTWGKEDDAEQTVNEIHESKRQKANDRGSIAYSGS